MSGWRKWVLRQTRKKRCCAAGLPCSRVYTYEDVDQDPHYNEAGWFADIPMPEGMALRTRRLVGSPFEFSADKPEYKPLEGFGCGNYEILGQLGYSKSRSISLRQDGLRLLRNPKIPLRSSFARELCQKQGSCASTPSRFFITR